MLKWMGKIKLTALCIAFLAMATAAMAQSTTQGAIGGTVFDSSGAVLPNATVTIHRDATNAEVKVTSDASGNFSAPLVEPGTYTVTIAATGFEDYRASSVIVQVGQMTTLVPRLTTGSATATVQVTAEAPMLNFESPDFSANLNQEALQDVPINNRRWSALAMTTPGVVADSSGFGLISVRGISTIMNNVEIDGADDNQAYYSEERGRTREAYSTSENAVREFAVNAGVYAAEYGRAAGGVINSVTKSGTNNIHGQLYFYDRESNWNAYQAHTLETVATYSSGNPIPTGFNSVHYKPEDVRKIYGFTVGGPLIKDKLFWIYTYDQHSRIFPAVGSPGTPSSFFALPAASTSGSCNLTTGYLSGDTSALDQQACTLAAREGLSSYGAGSAAYSTGLANLLPDLGFTPRAGYQEINTPKLDWQINSKEHASILYHRLNWDSPGGVQTAGVVAYGVDTQGTDFVKLDYSVAKLTSLISSNISNEILYQYGRELNDEGQQPFSAYTQTNLKSGAGNIPEVLLDNSGTSAGSGVFIGSPYYSYRPALPDERKWQVEDTLYYNKGNHTFKFGVDVLHNWDELNALNGTSPNVNGVAANGAYTYPFIGNYFADLASKSLGHGTCDTNQLSAATSALTGVGTYQCYEAGGYAQTYGTPLFSVTTLDYGLFAQDNWKFSPRLTLQVGVRYDFEFVPTPPGNLANPGVTATANHPSDKNNFGPRIGFSYDLYGNGKSVLRGGYGLYYGRLTNGILLNVLLNTGNTNGQYTTLYSPTSGSTVSPTFPNNLATPIGTAATPAVYYLGSHLQNPMVHEFDLVLQQEVGKGTVFSVSYLGGLGRELTNFINTNLDPSTTQTTTVTFTDTTGLSPIPNLTQVPVKTYTHYINSAYQSITGVFSNITSNYNGLVAEVQNRSLKSVQFDANYTWAHALDYNQNATTTTTPNNWLDPYAGARTNYGNSNYNIPNRLVLYVLYNLPNAAPKGSPLSYAINGWSINDSFQGGSGLPYSAGVSGNTSKSSITSGWNATGVTSYIPILGRNTYKFPRHMVDDVRVEKSFPIREGYNLQLLLNVFNIANHQNIDGISMTAYKFSSTGAATGTAAYQSAFNSVTSSNNSGFLFTPRELEIAAKFNF
jgi:hypothetical protein